VGKLDTVVYGAGPAPPVNLTSLTFAEKRNASIGMSVAAVSISCPEHPREDASCAAGSALGTPLQRLDE